MAKETSQYDDEDLNSFLFDDWDEFETNNTKRLTNSTNLSVLNSSANINCNDRLDISALCCDEELSGFDKNTGPTWIYPTNYPVRDYQFNIVSAALLKNTLVSLPTGLGKTFIAAVIMYNYYRWYPMGKIVFVAPTRPLVAQQIEACYNIMGIPPQDTIEMTGSMQTAARKIAWKQKRVFFATPQVVFNDLESGTCPGDLVRCLVLDEAHRAKGKHAYCQVVEGLTVRGHTLFRVLALSATPGSRVEDVISVVKNLHISHLELRSENCIDVSMYSHSRNMETIVVPLGEELSSTRQRYIEILDIYTRRLVQYNILTGNIGNLSKGRIIMLFKEYQNKEKSLRHPQHQRIMHDFTMVITLYHALELLTKHGARVFLNFFDEHTDKEWVSRDDNLTYFLERLRDDLGTNPFSINLNSLPDGSYPEIKEELKFGHPKFENLKKVIVNHFTAAKRKNVETKAIIFCEYRESVNLVHCLLLQCRPMIKPHVFVGQGLGAAGSSKDHPMKPFSQKQQLRVMKMFREGSCNVLVSTSVGEEGLDVGNVDLIICFDISNKSPVRLVQRCGRTGRERGGRVVILVTEGKEHQTLRECIMQRDSLNKRVLQSKELVKNLYNASPRMIPNSITPKCHKMFITVEKKKEEPKSDKNQKGQNKISDMFTKSSLGNDDSPSSNLKNRSLSKDEFSNMYPNGLPDFTFFEDGVEHWNTKKGALKYPDDEVNEKSKINLCDWLEWQRSLQYSVLIHHSSDSKMLSDLLQYADTKRFNLSSSTQNHDILTQEVNVQPKTVQSPPLKKTTTNTKSKPVKKRNNDIRQLFMKLNNNPEEEEKFLFHTKLKETLEEYGVPNNDLAKKNKFLEKDGLSANLIDLMVEIDIRKPKTENEFNKYKMNAIFTKIDNNIKPSGLSPSWKVPNVSAIDNLAKIKNLHVSMLKQTVDKSKDINKNEINSILSTSLNKTTYSNPDIYEHNLSKYPNSPVFNSSQGDCNSKYEKIAMKDDFDIGDIDDIFANSCSPKQEELQSISVLEIIDKTVVGFESTEIFPKNKLQTSEQSKENTCFEIKNNEYNNLLKTTFDNPSENDKKPTIVAPKQDENPLAFFGLESIEDIFEDEDFNESASKNINTNPLITPQKLTISEPEEQPMSPIICSQRSFPKKVNKSVINNFTSTPHCSKIKLFQDEHFNIEDDKYLSNIDLELNKTSLNVTQKHLTPSVGNDISKFRDISSNINKTDVSLFTVTQIIDIINNDYDSTKKNSESSHKNKSIEIQHSKNIIQTRESQKSSDDSRESIILCSQMPKKRVLKKTINFSKINHITILETSDSSDSDDNHKENISKVEVSKDKFHNKHDLNKCISQNLDSKRKYCSSDENNEHSPFFKKAAVDSPRPVFKSKLSLKEKLSSTLKTCNENPFNFIKEIPNNSSNGNPSFENDVGNCKVNQNISSDDTDFCHKITKVSQLEQFSKPSQPQWLRKQCNSQPIKKQTNKYYSDDDDDDFIVKKKTNKIKEHCERKKLYDGKKKKRKKPISDFIDYEAVQSEDSYDDSGDEHCTRSSEGLDSSIVNFICDEDHVDHDENVDMEAKYLQSVRSPVKNLGAFKIPALSSRKSTMSVFSQVDPDENTNYVLDSFCVDGDIGLTQRHDMSELEIAEAMLKKRKRRKKKRENKETDSEDEPVIKNAHDPSSESPGPVSKKRRVVRLKIQSESSTDDDIF